MALQFQTPTHKTIYEVVEDYLFAIDVPFTTHGTLPRFEVPFTDAPAVNLVVQPWPGRDDAYVMVAAWLVKKPNLGTELMQYLLNQNMTRLIGHFAIDDDGDLALMRILSGKDLAVGELRDSLHMLANSAAIETQNVINRFGGTKFGKWSR